MKYFVDIFHSISIAHVAFATYWICLCQPKMFNNVHQRRGMNIFCIFQLRNGNLQITYRQSTPSENFEINVFWHLLSRISYWLKYKKRISSNLLVFASIPLNLSSEINYFAFTLFSNFTQKKIFAANIFFT